MRISLIAPCWFPVPPCGYGGIERVVALLADGLVARGHDVTLFAAPGSKTTARLVTPLDEVPDPSVLGDPWHEARHSLTALLHDSTPDVIHDHSGPVGVSLAAMLSHDPPVVHTLHGPWTESTRPLYQLLHDRVHLVAISETQRAANPDVRYAGAVYNGVDVDAHPMSESKDDHLVFVGRANPDKNPAGAIDIARAANRPLKLIVKRNEPPEREYWDAHVKPRLGSDVDVIDDPSDEERTSVMGRAFAKLFPIQWDEPFGLVMAEAMACGTPVVATPRGAARELVEDGRTGFLRPSSDGITAALDRVDELSPHDCRSRVIDCFSVASMVDGYERVYRRAVRLRSPR